MIKYPKRLIEVDLPIRRISEHIWCEKFRGYGYVLILQRCRTGASSFAITNGHYIRSAEDKYGQSARFFDHIPW